MSAEPSTTWPALSDDTEPQRATVVSLDLWRSRNAECRVTAATRQSDGTRRFERAAAVFVTPRAPVASPEPVAAAPRLAPRAAALGGEGDAPPVAAAIAGALRRRERMAAAVVAVWPAEPATARPAAPAAARLAAKLAARGLASAPRGRLAWVTLSGSAEQAVPAIRRLGAAVEVPLVLAARGPRSEALDELLHELDFVTVVASDPNGPLARLALSTLPASAVACAPLAGAERALALAGLGGTRSLGAAVRAGS